MALPESYLQKYNALSGYLEAIQDAQPPERFTMKFMEGLGFPSSNDRLFIRVLKDLRFLNTDGVPQDRYFQFLDKSQSQRVLADAIREDYADLFAVNKNAHALPVEEVKNKLKTLYQGKKSDVVIDRIAKTFRGLCDEADFSAPKRQQEKGDKEQPPTDQRVELTSDAKKAGPPEPSSTPMEQKRLDVKALQYHINIVLPESRDQAVYDAIFKSMRDHLG